MGWLLFVVLLAAGCNKPASAPSEGDTETTRCTQDPVLPAPSQHWLRDTAQRSASGAGFAMDGDNNLVFVDLAGSIVRRFPDGKTDVWIANAAVHPMDIVVLSTGEVVLSDAGIASLVKYHPSGARTVILSGLDMPGDLEVDRKGNVYVAERLSSTIRRVNPASKVSDIIAKNMATVPAALSFSPDENTLYVGGADDGAVWALTRKTDGTFEAPRKFADVPGSADPCAGQPSGQPCGFLGLTVGTCTQTQEGNSYCQEPDTCRHRSEGDTCRDEKFGREGTCLVSEDSTLFCAPNLSCTDKKKGDDCTVEVRTFEYGEVVPKIVAGACDRSEGAGLYCRPMPPCEGKRKGDACVQEGGETGVCAENDRELQCVSDGPCVLKAPGDRCTTSRETDGICMEGGWGYGFCRPLGTCAKNTSGMPCVTDFGQTGVCRDLMDGIQYCRIPLPCDEKVAGDDCDPPGDMRLPGKCVNYADATAELDRDDVTADGLYCEEINDCDGKNTGDACAVTLDETGYCEEDDTGELYCEKATACTGLQSGDPCVDHNGDIGVCVQPFEQPLSCRRLEGCDLQKEGDTCDNTGTCTSDLYLNLVCQQIGPCENLSVGEPCVDPSTSLSGTCADRNDGGVYCRTTDPCRDASIGDPCQSQKTVTPGTCQIGVMDRLYCWQPEPCDRKADGEHCLSPSGEHGLCVDEGEGSLECLVGYSGVCREFGEGFSCTTDQGGEGVCVYDAAVGMICADAPPCFASGEGEACEGPLGANGTCKTDVRGTLVCDLPLPCAGKKEGEPCLDTNTGAKGTCGTGAFETAVCLPTALCENKNEGDECSLGTSGSGTCIATGQSALLWCYTGFSSGTIGGINTDACGNVYVVDTASEMLWQFSEDGKETAPAARLGQRGVTQLWWGGRDNDDWKAGSLYLGIDGAKEIIAVSIGIAGRPRPEPGSAPVSEPKPDTAYDCLNIPRGALGADAVQELGRPRGFHDVVFDNEGYIVGHDGFNLVRVNADGEFQIYATGIESVEGMDWLPDGSLVAATESGLARIYPNGAHTLIATDILAYGVIVGPDGMIYTDWNGRVVRVDPKTGDREVFVDPEDFGFQASLRSVDFDPDFTVMYMTTLGNGHIFAIPLDEAMNPSGKLTRFATIPGSGLQDALGVDICGNLYVLVFEHSALYRISPHGVVTKILQQDAMKHGHGLEWGSGIGGFAEDKLYLPQPNDNNTVVEVNIGVPSRRSTMQPATR